VIRFVEHVIAALAWIGVIAAGAWFAAPAIWRHLSLAEQAIHTVAAEEGARRAETEAANRSQSACSAQVAQAMDAGRAVAKAAQPRAAEPGRPQPLITADQIQAMIQ
jgi:hypothetical protein